METVLIGCGVIAAIFVLIVVAATIVEEIDDRAAS
jgi:hypothetical protein